MPPRPCHRRLLRTLHLALVLLFAIGLVVQPVLDALSEYHELTAHAASPHGHADDHHDEDASSLRGEEPEDHDGPVHGLLHHSHCCGHTVGLNNADLPLPDFHWPAHVPVDAAPTPVAASHAATPFRPPISA
ncbi:hypothetical protein [Tahibacter amnicola]|uniref:DUF2946 domain-containing protein n=1 Tax=Tahibacter amnicola TaxID=2976241 RepID=A0ABY6BEG5_9GAMM|nr:hypothetical protein [Tahibacter amnicola]UXI66297.1 hypothetical protein N4264_16240 [Tahibacter amnicola]